jgi:hypothetical protein
MVFEVRRVMTGAEFGFVIRDVIEIRFYGIGY